MLSPSTGSRNRRGVRGSLGHPLPRGNRERVLRPSPANLRSPRLQKPAIGCLQPRRPGKGRANRMRFRGTWPGFRERDRGFRVNPRNRSRSDRITGQLVTERPVTFRRNERSRWSGVRRRRRAIIKKDGGCSPDGDLAHFRRLRTRRSQASAGALTRAATHPCSPGRPFSAPKTSM
jgi:hypothetical protein